jgi:hypothetical protein
MNFNSRETYFAAVANWRLRYNAQLKHVRQLKLEFKEAQRAFSKAGGDTDYYSLKEGQHKGYSAASIVLERARWARGEARQETLKLELERAESRVEANRQYHEQRGST